MSEGAIPSHRTTDKAQPMISDWIEAMSDKAEKTLDWQDRLAHTQTAIAAAVGRTHTIEREKLPQKGNTNLR